MAAPMYCTNCGSIDKPRTRTKGSFLLEVFLWLCLILPGVLYTVWRLTTREKVCRACGAPNMIPTDSPKAKASIGIK